MVFVGESAGLGVLATHRYFSHGVDIDGDGHLRSFVGNGESNSLAELLQGVDTLS